MFVYLERERERCIYTIKNCTSENTGRMDVLLFREFRVLGGLRGGEYMETWRHEKTDRAPPFLYKREKER